MKDKDKFLVSVASFKMVLDDGTIITGMQNMDSEFAKNMSYHPNVEPNCNECDPIKMPLCNKCIGA